MASTLVAMASNLLVGMASKLLGMGNGTSTRLPQSTTAIGEDLGRVPYEHTHPRGKDLGTGGVQHQGEARERNWRRCVVVGVFAICFGEGHSGENVTTHVGIFVDMYCKAFLRPPLWPLWLTARESERAPTRRNTASVRPDMAWNSRRDTSST